MARIQKNLLLTPNDIAKFQKLAEKAQQITIENLKKDEESVTERARALGENI